MTQQSCVFINQTENLIRLFPIFFFCCHWLLPTWLLPKLFARNRGKHMNITYVTPTRSLFMKIARILLLLSVYVCVFVRCSYNDLLYAACYEATTARLSRSFVDKRKKKPHSHKSALGWFSFLFPFSRSRLPLSTNLAQKEAIEQSSTTGPINSQNIKHTKLAAIYRAILNSHIMLINTKGKQKCETTWKKSKEWGDSIN